MQSKSLLIAIAALAVTATGVHAHAGGTLLNRANLSEGQRAAIEEAHQLRVEGDLTAARDVLIEAGIDETALQAIREAARAARHALHDAIEADDYEAFKVAVAGTPLEDVVTSEADFKLFKEAHALKRDGSYAAAAELFAELGITPSDHRVLQGRHKHFGHRFDTLSDDEREALRVAAQANDRETVRAILREAGAE